MEEAGRVVRGLEAEDVDDLLAVEEAPEAGAEVVGALEERAAGGTGEDAEAVVGVEARAGGTSFSRRTPCRSMACSTTSASRKVFVMAAREERAAGGPRRVW